jgi:hypothetical protein
MGVSIDQLEVLFELWVDIQLGINVSCFTYELHSVKGFFD